MKLLFSVSVLLVACSFPRAEGAAQSCKVDEDCVFEVGRNVCDTGDFEPVCVECLPGRAEACVGTTPACGGTSCRACSSHSECASDACLPDGSCALETQVIYLKQGGSGAAGINCSKQFPCGTLNTAIGLVDSTRSIIRVTGTIGVEDTIDNKTVTFLGSRAAPDSILRAAGGGGTNPILRLRNGAKVQIADVGFEDSKGEGINLTDAGTTLRLFRSRIVNSADEGINQSNGELTVEQSLLSKNRGGGITVAANKKFVITNSIIVGNTRNGGVAAPTPGPGSVMAFNTIADNRDDGVGTIDAGGVSCDVDAFTFSNNIIFRNTGGMGNFKQTAGLCKFDGSFIGSSTAAEIGTLGFAKDTDPRDYHLTQASPSSVKDVAGVVCTGLVDYDGESRPQGGFCDLGADELKQ
jgi:Right handed beta helix region